MHACTTGFVCLQSSCECVRYMSRGSFAHLWMRPVRVANVHLCLWGRLLSHFKTESEGVSQSVFLQTTQETSQMSRHNENIYTDRQTDRQTNRRTTKTTQWSYNVKISNGCLPTDLSYWLFQVLLLWQEVILWRAVWGSQWKSLLQNWLWFSPTRADQLTIRYSQRSCNVHFQQPLLFIFWF